MKISDIMRESATDLGDQAVDRKLRQFGYYPDIINHTKAWKIYKHPKGFEVWIGENGSNPKYNFFMPLDNVIPRKTLNSNNYKEFIGMLNMMHDATSADAPDLVQDLDQDFDFRKDTYGKILGKHNFLLTKEDPGIGLYYFNYSDPNITHRIILPADAKGWYHSKLNKRGGSRWEDVGNGTTAHSLSEHLKKQFG